MAAVELSEGQRRAVDALLENLAVDEALQSLPPDQRDAVRARFSDDGAYDDIAERAQTTPAAIRQRVTRGLSTLRTLLKEER